MNKLFYLKSFILFFAIFCFGQVGIALAQIDIKTEDVTCEGKKDGKATITVTGASGNFRYSISKDCYLIFECDGTSYQSSNTFSDLEEGTYTAKVKDIDSDCEFSKDFTIKEPSELDLSISGSRFVYVRVCDAPPTIVLTANASGGTPPYSYSPSQSINVSGSGTYSFTVTDKNSCTYSESVTVRYIDILCSRDPNDIVGPVGVGDEKWIAKNEILPYTIRFENDPEFATAPAQVVKIVHPLDSNVNINSLRLGNLGFANQVFEVPQDRTYYSSRLDVTKTLGVAVDVTAGIDVTKREAFWIFESIDPATGLPPQAANLGFLPINDSTAIGEGFVSYTIKPGRHTQTGDSIYAEAEIIFDINEPIWTPIIFNTIDALPPTSRLNPVPAEVHPDSALFFKISAQDDSGGSGVATYDVFISENEEPFKLLAAGLGADSLLEFRGREGVNYCAYSLARDRVYNLENRKTQGDVCFKVPRRAKLELISPAGGEVYCGNDLVNISWVAKSVSDVNILLSEDGVNYQTIASAIPASDTAFVWKIPSDLPSGNNYLFKIQDIADSSFTSVSKGAVTVNQASSPVISASNGTTICSGDSTILSVGSGYQKYVWSTGDTTQQIVVTSPGNYIIEALDTNGCVGKDSINIMINPAPAKPIIYYNEALTLCQGDTIPLTAPLGYTKYLWSTGDTTQTIFVVSSGSYFLKGMNEAGCLSSSSDVVNITINPLPEKPVVTANGPTAICPGESVTLSAPEGYTYYRWTNGASTQAIVVYEAGSYAVAVTDSSGCVSVFSDPVDVTEAQPTPQPTITVEGPTTFCEGESVVLSAPEGYTTYNWSNGATTQSITVTTSGDYTVAVAEGTGCLSSYSAPVAVTTLTKPSQPIIATSGPTTFCQGESVVLSAPAGLAGYQWSTGETTPSITVSTSGTYSVVVVDSSGCASLASEGVDVIVNPLPAKPVVVANGATTLCEGDSVTLSAPTGFAVYTWSNGATSETITVAESGTYSVEVTNESGCVSDMSDPVAVTVYATPKQPVITAIGETTFCEGGSVELVAPAGYTSYLWSNGATTPSIEVSTSGAYAVTVTNANGCVSPVSNTINTQVLPLPGKPIITADGPVAFCEGGKVTLAAPAGFAAYLWSTSETTASIVVQNSGSYTVQTTNTEGCTSVVSDPVAVTVYETPEQPVITANGPTSFCEGEEVILSAPSGYVMYEWSNGATTESINVVASGLFTVKVSDSNGCRSVISEAVNVTVNPLPQKPVVTLEGADTLYAGETAKLHAPADYAGYVWSTGETAPSITVDATGSYSVQVINEAGCSSPSSEAIHIVAIPRPPKPSIVVSGATAFCEGGSVELMAPAGYVGYLWSNGATTQAIQAIDLGHYTVVVTDQYGLSSLPSDPVVVEVFANPEKPVITVVGDTVLCNTETVELIAPAGYAGYLWSNGAITQRITVNTPGAYTVEVVTEHACRSEVSDAVVISKTPDLLVDAGENKKVYYFSGHPSPRIPHLTCATLTANVIAAGSGNYTLQWNTGEYGNTLEVCPTEDTWYTVTVTDELGCTHSDQVKVCAVDIRCTTHDHKGNFVKVCYLPANGESKTFCLPLGKAKQYLKKPDYYLGGCENAGPCESKIAGGSTARNNGNGVTDELTNKVVLEAVPNPFRVSTEIRLQVPETDQIKVEVFTFAGVKVDELYHGVVEGGREYQMKFIPSATAASGVYICKMTTSAGKVYTAKLIFNR